MGGILGGFFSLYSSFAEQCACYPYIFPTIFPHRRTTVYTDSRTVEKYREQLAQIFTQIGLSFLHSQCQSALENETLRK